MLKLVAFPLVFAVVLMASADATAQVRPADSKHGTLVVDVLGNVQLRVSATESWPLTFTRQQLLDQARQLNGRGVTAYGKVEGVTYKVYGLVLDPPHTHR